LRQRHIVENTQPHASDPRPALEGASPLLLRRSLPLPRVFASSVCVLHHGGAGTCAAALRCACAQVIAPLHFDQFAWAERLAYMRLGARLDLRRRLRANGEARESTHAGGDQGRHLGGRVLGLAHSNIGADTDGSFDAEQVEETQAELARQIEERLRQSFAEMLSEVRPWRLLAGMWPRPSHSCAMSSRTQLLHLGAQGLD